MAKEPSTTLSAKSNDVTENMPTNNMKMYWYILFPDSPNKNFAQLAP